ncbi:MAG: sigma-70 family RNA polymerase sigma factor [Verrucomicrobiota bacterium]
MTSDSNETLRDFSRNRSEEAFRTLVRQHSPVVYGTALRKLGGDRAAAQDVTQEVFTLLARKANRLESVVLGGWLYRQACRRAANHVRSESRRKTRERVAAEAMVTSSPADAFDTRFLDDALLALPAKDRDALVLRFFEGKDFKLLGSALGLSEDAARKRVARALERLGGNLKRKGIAVGAILLGETMGGYGNTPVPSQLISTVTENSLRTGAASSLVPALSLLVPLAAGVIATSLVAGPMHQLTAADPPSATASTPAPNKRTTLKPVTSPKDLSLEQLITEVKQANSKPGNALTALQLGILFERIDPSLVPEFIRLANGRMTAGERVSIYPRLLEKSLSIAAKATMDFVLQENVGKQVDAHSGTNLLTNLFDNWVRTDRAASESWLLENWENPVLRESAFSGPLRDFLMIEVVDKRFSHEGTASVLELVRRIPAVEDQAAALRGIAGMNSWRGSWQRGDRDKWLEFHQALKEFPDVRLGRELMRNFWTKLSEERTDEVTAIQATLEPMDRFQVSLGWLGVRSKRGEETLTLSGMSVASSPVTDQDQREAAALAAGLAAGLSRSQVLGEIGRVVLEVRRDEECFKWLDEHRHETDMDDALAEKVRKLFNASGWETGKEMQAVEWAARIANPELRLRLCRGVFRKVLFHAPESAFACLKNNDLPPDVAAEFQTILNATP